ncbi:MAG: chromosome condensation protein [Thermoguttaceae bacterium]|jgi:hypothetical protein
MIFPLPLNPFEESLWLEDSPAYPCHIAVRMGFRGRLQREALAGAIATAIARHPLLGCNIERNAAGQATWVPARQPGPEIAWSALPDDGRWPSLPRIDACRDFPVRFWAAEGGDRSQLVVNVHHACADGLGVMQFLGDLLLAYAAAVGGPAAARPMRRVDPSLLARRGEYGLTAGKLLRLLPKVLWWGLLGAREFLMRKPTPLVPHVPVPRDAPLPENYPAVLVHEFSVAETTAMRVAARQRRVTVNDQLVSAWFLAMDGWRQSRGLGGDKRWLRLMVPMSLRGPEDREMPAANIVSTLYIDRRPRELVDPAVLLDGIHDELALYKRHQLGVLFVLSLQLCRWLPGGLERTVRRKPSLGTAILTNVSRPLDLVRLPREDGKLVAGNVVLETCDGFPPIRPGICAALGVMGYAGRLRLGLHYDARVLDRDQASDLLQRFVAAASPPAAAG